MPSHKIKTIPQRRKREGKTNYKKRLSLLKSGKPRLIVRKFNKNIIAQIVIYDATGDKIEAQAHSKELEKYGWKESKNNVPASYLVGLILSKKTKIKEAILDAGLQKLTKGSRIYSLVKGCIDGGMEIPHDAEVFPSKERITGKHIAGKDIEKIFNATKEKIIKG
jgi:large subunit ribosomal protein L18